MNVHDLKNHPRFGSFAAIAAVCGVSREAVRHWKSIPGEHCRRIEEATDGELSCHDLRPDIFGPAPVAEEARDVA
jgi:DNA-binding transcriptional regulator YdaS (Cro superfamily)